MAKRVVATHLIQPRFIVLRSALLLSFLMAFLVSLAYGRAYGIQLALDPVMWDYYKHPGWMLMRFVAFGGSYLLLVAIVSIGVP